MLNKADLPLHDPGFKVTDNALSHLRRTLMHCEDPKPVGIRIGVKKAGCSGWEYQLSFAYPENQTPLDYLFSFEDIDILIDKEIYSKFFKGGTVLDYRKEGINEGLAFENPNVANQCGCGESFTLSAEG